MTALPSAASFNGASVTEGDFKTAISNLLLYLSGQFGSTGVPIDAQAAMGVIFGSAPVPKTGAYSVVAGDRGKTISCSGTFTVSLPDVATVGEGFSVAIANTGSGDITIDPASTQLIGGAATKTLDPHTMAMCSVVGGGWETVGSPPTATTTRSGIVQLVDSYSSTSLVLAPTANALKSGVDAALAAVNLAPTAGSTYILCQKAAEATTTSASYTKIGPQMNVIKSGTIRFYGEHHKINGGASGSSYLQVLKNGAVVGGPWATTSTTYVARSVDLSVQIGDEIIFQEKIDGATVNSNAVRNLRATSDTLVGAIAWS